MSDFINRQTKQIVMSGNDPDFPESEWLKLNGLEVPECSPIFWKVGQNEITEMTVIEKQNITESMKQYKSKQQILNEIFNHPQVGAIESIKLMNKYPAFAVCLEQGNINAAMMVIDGALSDDSITLGVYNVLKNIVTEKV